MTVRPTVSMRGDIYFRFMAECERRGVSMSSMVTAWVDALDVPVILISPRTQALLTVRCAAIRHERTATGQLPSDVTVDQLAEALILRALDAEGSCDIAHLR